MIENGSPNLDSQRLSADYTSGRPRGVERQYLILNVICGYTSREIADAFNDTVAAVTKRIQRAKKKMKGYIQNLLV